MYLCSILEVTGWEEERQILIINGLPGEDHWENGCLTQAGGKEMCQL